MKMTIDQAIRQALRIAARYPDEAPLVIYRLGNDYGVATLSPRGSEPIVEVDPEEIRHVRAAA